MIRTFVIVVACILLGNTSTYAQHKTSRIYGELTTVSNRKISGYITWGKNKMYWIDHFNATKLNNPYASFFQDRQHVKFKNGTAIYPAVHVFSCRFGEIRSIRPSGPNQVKLCVRDGYIIDLKKGNTNDIGSDLYVESVDGENVRIPWSMLSEIEFMEVPEELKASKHTPITGIVRSSVGIFKGIIQWDLDENSLEHILDGKSANGDLAIAFKSIKTITKREAGCIVLLQSGNELSLWGSNDVDTRNRGIYVSMSSIGRVYIPWKHFLSFEALPGEDVKNLSYADCNYSPVRLYGSVEKRDGTLLNGTIVYDLDEAMDFEMLDGKNGDITYAIPFYAIKIIEPKNYKYSWMELTNGANMVLGGNCDVNAENDGVLLYRAERETIYIPWKEVKRITFWTE